MLSVSGLDIRFGEKHLFKNISAQVHLGNRIGLVGVNGAGKSTLMKIMAGVSATDDGVVSCSKHFSVGYLPQESDPIRNTISLYDEAKTAFAGLLAMQEEVETLNHTISSTDPESPDFEQLLQRQGMLQNNLDSSHIYAMRGMIEKVLQGLGFKQEDLEKEVNSFSGGWQMRLRLAKMLLEAPSLLLLDEPTNHLDLESLRWLEQFLINYDGALVAISHDRAFLDKVTKVTWEVSLGNLNIFKGNYSYYVKEKEERLIIERGAYENQQAKIKQTMQFVDRFRSKASKAKQVQSRVKQLDKMDLIELSASEQQIRFTFPPAPDSGRDVLEVENLSKSYGDKHVFSGASFQLQRGDKVAIVGVNGAGKSTLVKILADELAADEGKIKFGSNVIVTYFGQHQAQELSPQLSALDTMALASEDMTITKQRSLLGAFLFRGEEVDKKVGVLSGGEKSRLALAKMIASPANCMLLDEPTNHLDMGSQEILQDAMGQYDGTIIVVSHNRYFLDSFVNKVFEVKDGKINVYDGNISEYLTKIEQIAALEKQDKQSATEKVKVASVESGVGKENRKERKKMAAQRRQERSKLVGEWVKKSEESEKKIEEYETLKEKIEEQLADPELYSDEKAWAEVSEDYDDCKRHLERSYASWEEAQGKIEEGELKLAQKYGEVG
ncbi:MAG: ABC-F family ATP-binding cassette domain-containing protein [Desulfotalea sp.]